MRWRPTGLWQHRDFMKLWVGQTISVFGSLITGVALPLTAVLMLSASPFQMGLLAAIGSAPVLLFGLFAGVWVDRLRRRPILIATDLGRAVVLGSIPVSFLLGLLRMEQLYVVAALVGILNVFFDVAHQSYLPSLVTREELVEGNSKLEASSSAAEVGAFSLAGALVQWFSAPMAIFIDAVSFLVSALCVGLIRRPEPPPSPPEQQEDVWREIVEGLRLVLGNPLLRAMIGHAGTHSFFGGFFGSLYFLYAIRELGLEPAPLGVIVGLGGVGSLVGALSAERVVRRFGLGPTLIGMAILGSAFSLLIPLAPGPVILAGAFLIVSQLLGDASDMVYIVNEVSLRQMIVPGRLLGRANASRRVLVGGLAPIGAVAAGILGEIIGLRLTLLIAGVGFVVAILWLVFSPILTLREQPAPLAEPDLIA